MKIKCVRIKNFRGYGENIYSNDKFYIFDNLDKYKIIILTGLNGHGKTSFYEAIEWCLTGTIKRLEKVMEKTHESIKKTSSNLIFNKHVGKIREEAIVEIIFDNNLKLVRKTKANSVVENSSEFELFEKDKIYNGQDSVEKILKELTTRNVDISSLYKSISLGQETLANFMRGETWRERKRDLLNLFNLEDFDDIKEKADKKNFAKLNKLNYKKYIEEIKELKIYVDSIFKSSGFNINQYLEEIQEYNKKLTESYKEKIHYKVLSKNTESILGFITYMINKEKEVGANIRKLESYKDELIEYLYLEKYLEIKNNKNLLMKVRALDIKKLEKKSYVLHKKDVKYNKYIKKLDEKIEKLQEKDFRLKHLINNDTFIDDKIIDRLIGILNGIVEENDRLKIEQLKILNSKYLMEINSLRKEIDENKSEYNKLNDLNSNYTEALNKIRLYTIESNIEKCPICGNEDINLEIEKNNLSNNEKILSIIDKTLINNNSNLENKLRKISLKETSEKAKIKKYKNEVIQELNNIKEKYIEFINTNIKRNSEFIISIQSYLEKNRKKLNDIDDKIKKYSILEGKLYELFNCKKNLNLINNIIINQEKLIINMVNKKFNLYLESEIKEKKDLLALTLLNQKIYNSFNNISKVIKEISKDLDVEKCLFIELKKFTNKYSISEENIEQIKKYDKYSKKESYYNEIENLIKFYKNDRKEIYDKFDGKSNLLLRKKLDQYKGLGNYIYKAISPHPFYCEFDFNDSYGGTEVVLKDNKNINLSHIFSNAQVNILALSIFLGIGLLDNEIKLDNLFIDDPIQSMDDINVLAFIDLLRTILISEKVNKRLLISTHNREFASLLKIKLRNLGYKEFNFKYYGTEGPIIEEFSN